VGNNFAAIEQNLIASGVDPLIAADISQQLAFNPGLTQADLATNLSKSFGNNIYDVNTATTYPTSVLPGSGGLLSDVATAGNTSATTTPTTPTGSSTGLTTSQITSLIKGGVGLLGATGLVNTVTQPGNTTVPTQTPTQGTPQNSSGYYNQLQQYYNGYLPQTPRDVVSPLYDWYNSSFGQTPPTYNTMNTAAVNSGMNMNAQNTAKPTMLNSLALRDASYGATTQAVASAGTTDQKADLYNRMLSAGYTDETARALVERTVGPQTNADWAYLQQLAQPQAQPQPVAPPVSLPPISDSSYANQIESISFTGTPAEKADLYNSMIRSGYSDAAVKALVDSSVGTQSSSDWAYLQQLAASR
jgi:hypothetical protein